MIGALALALATTPADVAKARSTMAAFMHCMVNRKGYRLRALMDAPVSGKAPPQAASLMDSACLTEEVQLRFNKELMRGALFNEFYRKEFGNADVADLATVPPVVYAPVGSTTDPVSMRYTIAMSIGDCAVRRAPKEARALVLSAVVSPEEMQAIEAFKPALSACIDDKNTLRFSQSVIRDLTAEALYRLTAAKRGLPHV